MNERPVVTYQTSVADVTAADLVGGFWEGWPSPPSPETHLRLLAGSAHVVLARVVDGERSGQVVGFITAISDGVLSAYIPLLEVLPGWRSQGIGGELVTRLLAEVQHLYMVDLLCDPEVQPFYDRFGLQRAEGMLHRNYARQSGD